MRLPDHALPIGLVTIASLLSIGAARAGQDAPGPLPSDPVFDAIAIDGAIVSGRIRSLAPDGRVELVDQGGGEQIVEGGRLVKLARVDRIPSRTAPETALLVFAGGDQLRGMIDSADERSVVIRSAIVGELEVPLDIVLGFTIGPPADPGTEPDSIATLRDESRTSDLLLLENGDRREVTFTSVGGNEVAYLDTDRALRLPRETVRAIGLDPGLARPPEPEGRSFDLILNDGSRLRLLEPSSVGGRLSGTSSFGAEIEFPLDRLAELYVLDDSIAYLSDLEAAREVTVPYVGPSRAVGIDSSVLGGPLTVAGRRIVRGLGTQSRSLLAYPIDPAARRFQAAVALDDAAGALGNVVFRVLVDGEERFASPPMTVGDEPRRVDVDVAGGRFLILATEFGRGGGIRDFAAWIEPRLIRGRGDPESGK